MKRYFVILLLFAAQLASFAQNPNGEQAKVDTKEQLKGDIEEVLEGEKKKARFFQSLSFGVDLVGPVMRSFGSQGDYQGFLQLNIKGKFLPVVEVGYGSADKEDYYTKVKYKAKAPFGRAGIDFNFLKNKLDDYRVTGGVRYGFTHFNYDTSTPVPENDESGATGPTIDTSGTCTLHWAELVVGVDAKVWGPLHMGWTIRYRRKISCKYDDCDPLYAPGFGNASKTAQWMALYTIGFQI